MDRAPFAAVEIGNRVSWGVKWWVSPREHPDSDDSEELAPASPIGRLSIIVRASPWSPPGSSEGIHRVNDAVEIRRGERRVYGQ